MCKTYGRAGVASEAKLDWTGLDSDIILIVADQSVLWRFIVHSCKIWDILFKLAGAVSNIDTRLPFSVV
jgi:hypothetical protein